MRKRENPSKTRNSTEGDAAYEPFVRLYEILKASDNLNQDQTMRLNIYFDTDKTAELKLGFDANNNVYIHKVKAREPETNDGKLIITACHNHITQLLELYDRLQEAQEYIISGYSIKTDANKKLSITKDDNALSFTELSPDIITSFLNEIPNLDQSSVLEINDITTKEHNLFSF